MLLFSSLVDLTEDSRSSTNTNMPIHIETRVATVVWTEDPSSQSFACVGHCHRQPSDQGKQIVVFPKHTVPAFNYLCQKELQSQRQEGSACFSMTLTDS